MLLIDRLKLLVVSVIVMLMLSSVMIDIVWRMLNRLLRFRNVGFLSVNIIMRMVSMSRMFVCLSVLWMCVGLWCDGCLMDVVWCIVEEEVMGFMSGYL